MTGLGDGDLAAGGKFFIKGLQPGDYRLRISVGGFASEWWQDKASKGTATPVTVTAGNMTTVNPRVDPGGAIAGKVTAANGAPLPNDSGAWAQAVRR